MGINRSIDFLPNAKHLSVLDKSAFADVVSLHGHIHNRPVQASSSLQGQLLADFTEDTLQDALKVTPDFYHRKKQ